MTLEQKVIGIIEEQNEGIGIGEISNTSDLETDLGIDSFGVLMIIDGLEDKFGVTIDETSFYGIRTVLDIVNVLQNKYGIRD